MLQTPLQGTLAEHTPESQAILSEILRDFEGKSDELIPMLQRVQKSLRYLPEWALLEVAHLIGLPAAHVFGVATFYAQFRLRPVGRHIIRVCRGTACHVRGSGSILKDIEAHFRVAPGETTKDKLFTVETVACFGSCALAPVLLVDESVHGRMNPAKARNILKGLDGEVVVTSMGDISPFVTKRSREA